MSYEFSFLFELSRLHSSIITRYFLVFRLISRHFNLRLAKYGGKHRSNSKAIGVRKLKLWSYFNFNQLWSDIRDFV